MLILTRYRYFLVSMLSKVLKEQKEKNGAQS